MRAELFQHLLASEGEDNGRVIIDGFIARLEGLVEELQRPPFQFRTQTLLRYTLAQLSALRSALERGCV